MKKLRIQTYEYVVAYRRKSNIFIDKKTPFTVIDNTWRYWAADPFLFEKNGETYIFAELFDRIKLKGVIGYCKISGNLGEKVLPWKVIIEEDYHLSFPYIYEDENEIYIMPESKDNRSIYLYRSVLFPDKWERSKTIRQGVEYVDSVLMDSNACRYILTTNMQGDELHLLDLEKNTDKVIRTDGKTLRNGGKILTDISVRIAQNSIHEYGEGLIFYNYSLVDEQYSEHEIDRIYPGDIKIDVAINANGIHTYNSSNNFEVIDIEKYGFNIVSFIPKVLNTIQRKLQSKQKRQ